MSLKRNVRGFISVVLVLFIVLGVAVFLLVNNVRNGDLKLPVQVQNELAPEHSSFQTFSLQETDLHDSQTKFYFSDGKDLYSLKLDGSDPEKIATFPRNIAVLTMLQNGDLLTETDFGTYEKNPPGETGKADYKQVLIGDENNRTWILRSGMTEPERTTLEEYSQLYDLVDSTRLDRWFAKELLSGGAGIYWDKLDTLNPMKVGTLHNKLITFGCEVAPCPGKEYPGEFYPSFDGSYLLNRPPSGGGLGESAVVVSQDGSKVYDINFYWYVSSAIWLDNDKLLISGQDGKQTIFTFNKDGTLENQTLDADLGNSFGQKDLSPSKRYLLLAYGRDAVIVFDFEQKKSDIIESFDKEKAKKDFSLRDEDFVSRTDVALGWGKNSDKVLYASTTETYSGAHDKDRVLQREIKVYDVNSHATHVIAKLNQMPQNADEYLVESKPVANITHFAIY